MANIYSGMTSAQKDNERKYLNNLVSGGGGNAEWAKSQLKQLDASGSSSNTSSNKSSSVNLSPNKSGGGNSVSIIDNMVKNAENSTGKSINDNATKTDSGWYLPKTNNSANVSRPSSQISYDEVEEKEYNPYEELEEYYRKAYQDLEAQIREQNRLAVEQGTNRLNAQKANINQAADENARQAYVQYMQSQKALPQQLASQGISGGATETANLGLQTAYQNNVNSINQNKANRLQEIDNAIVDLQNTGDLSTVEQVLANNQAALDAYTANFDKGVGYNQWANEFNANRQDTMADLAYREKVYADNMAQQQLENEWYERNYNDSKKQEETNRVISLLENGMVDANYASTLLGIPVAQLNDFVNYINKARQLELSNTQSLINNRNSGGSGNGGNGGGNGTVVIGDTPVVDALSENYYNLIDRINNKYYGNTVGKESGVAVIAPNASNTYAINSDISRAAYLDLIIAETLKDESLTAEQQVNFLNSLEISDDDIERVASYLGGTSSNQNSSSQVAQNTLPTQSSSTATPTTGDIINFVGNGLGLNPAIDMVAQAKENEKNNPYTIKLQEYYKSIGLNDEEVATRLAEYKKANVANQAKILREAGIM